MPPFLFHSLFTPTFLHSNKTKKKNRFEGRFSFQETFPAPSILPTQLPKQLFSLPAVEALASIQLYDTHGNLILCTSVPLTNTVSAQSPVITIASVSLTAASVALAAITGLLAFLSSAAVLTTMPLAATGGTGGTGTVGTAGGLSPSVADVVSFCQFIAMSGSLTLEYPELLQQWTQNFGWSMGLVQADGWNDAINSLRTRTSRTQSASAAGAEENETNATKMLFNGQVGAKDKVDANATTTTSRAFITSGDPNAPAKVLSMQSMMDGAVKNFVEQAVHNKTHSQAISMAVAKVDLSHILKPAVSKRQVPPAPPQALPATLVPPPLPASAPAPTPVIGADMLPSLQDASLMNRLGDHLSVLNVFDAPKPTTTPTSASPTPQVKPPVSWPQGGYHPSTNALSPPGLVSYGQRLQIPAKNMFMTSLFLFLVLLLATSMLALLLRIGLEAYAYFRPGKFTKLRRRFTSYYLGGMLRVVLLAYFAVATMAFYQLTLKDSWAITLLAVMTVLLFLALVTYITLRLRRAGGTSLFFDERIKSKYGALYDQYVLSAYWFFVPVLFYQMSKAAIVGLGQCSEENHEHHHNHGSSESWAQVSLLLLVEVVFAALMIWKRPFSDRTPNRLNSTLGCVRVLNVVMLAILIEGTALSAVSRTVVGVVITGTQALVMIVLACLISYQLGKALWCLWGVIKASREVKKNKNKTKDLLSDEKVFVISVKDEKLKYDEDDDADFGGERPGRRANEFSRSGDESMTGLVGMMGIGTNPTIQCTPASDDEDDGDDDFSSRRRRSMGIYPLQDQWDEKNSGIEEADEEETGEVTTGLRESTQSYGSQSSHILDYYKAVYLPSNLKSSSQNDSGSSDHGLNLGSISEDKGDASGQEFSPDRLGLLVPDVGPNGPWVQSAYMTRRRSESAFRNGQIDSSTELEERATIGSESLLSLSPSQQQQRRRPASMGGERQVSDSMRINGSSGLSGRATISCGSRAGREGVRRESLPVFRSTFIPESLLAGPPPPSTLPRRASVSSAMLATPPSLSPVLGFLHDQVSPSFPSPSNPSPVESASAPVSTTTTTTTTIPISGSSTSVSSQIQNFSEYRFPDERQPLSIEGPSRSVVAVQRNIHPLSPFHPDYQHPNDIYNTHIPSPNEAGPAFGPFQRSNSLASSTIAHGNIPNTPQNGINSRRESRAVAAFRSPPSASSSALTNVPSASERSVSSGTSSQAAHARRGDAPGLKIITSLKKFTPAPQIPLPTLPPTPFTSTLPDNLMAFSITTAGGGSVKGSNIIANNNHSHSTTGSASSSSLSTKIQHHQQQTPTSITWNGGSQDSMFHTLTQQESNTSAAYRQRRNSSSDAGLSSTASGGSNRQRVLSSTPIVLSGGGSRPLTVSSVSRRESQAGR